jgi:hypothetical protein
MFSIIATSPVAALSIDQQLILSLGSDLTYVLHELQVGESMSLENIIYTDFERKYILSKDEEI